METERKSTIGGVLLSLLFCRGLCTAAITSKDRFICWEEDIFYVNFCVEKLLVRGTVTIRRIMQNGAMALF